MTKSREYQLEHIDRIVDKVTEVRKVLAQLPTGGGKCLGYGTEVLMFDGTFKQVQDIYAGELLMGIDSTPRKVLSTCNGKDNMYRISPLKGESFICNEPHILSLKSSGTDCGLIKDKVYNISIKDYIKLNKTKKWFLKLYKSSILDFDEKKVNIPPYILGIWLGDGNSREPVLTNMDSEIINAWIQYAKDNNFDYYESDNRESPSKLYYINNRYKRGGIREFLRKYNILNNKHIPTDYLYNSVEVRMELLAGLIDTDGYLHHNGYEIFTVSKKLCDDICYLTRSLGFSTNVGKKKNCKGYRIMFYGEGIEYIPVKISRKKASEREQKKDALRTSFEVEYLGHDEYFGFEIDGDHLFIITKDFIVTHNTEEFVQICKRFVYNTDKSCLILVHRKELMQQAKKRFKKVLGIDATLITSSTSRYTRAKVYIGMVESTVKRLDCFDNVGLVIIDEAHMANFNKVHSIFLDQLIIGFTATPVSSSKLEPMNKFYNAIVCGPQIPELIKLGFLAQNFTICPTDIVDQAMLESNVDNRKGDFNENVMATAYSKPRYISNTVKFYRKYCKGQKTIVFNVNIAHSKLVCEFFNQCGFEARHIDSEDDTNRDATLKWFKETKDAILCNVGIATTGYDEPTVDWIILNFSTLSPSKFIQCSGRGSRIIGEDFISEFQIEYPYLIEEKTHFGILDLGGNGMRFGDWNYERDWEMLYNYPEEPGTGVSPSKTCPECEGLVHTAKHICDCIKQPATKDENGEYILCGHIFDRKKAAEESDISDMMLITRGIDYEKLQEKYKNKYDFFVFEKMSEEVVRDIYFDNSNPSQTTIDKGFTYYYSLCKNWWVTFMSEKQYIKDITNSQFHIDKAKYCYKAAIEKYKKKHEIFNINNCRYCNSASVKHCNDCDFPVCENHSAGESCIHCATVHSNVLQLK